MSKKTIISIMAGVGMTLGSLVPMLWNGDLLGGMSILLGLVGGIVGVWLGVKIANALG
jgi:uncharacterized membrane protein